MRLAIGLLFLGLVTPIAALAEPAIVRSGEHNGYVRLVVYLPENAAWTVSETEGGAELNVEKWSDGFVTDTVFSRIPKTRLQSVEGREDQLLLGFDCACELRTESLPNGPVVIDIVDADPEAEVETAVEDRPEEIAQPTAEIVQSDTSVPDNDDRDELPLDAKPLIPATSLAASPPHQVAQFEVTNQSERETSVGLGSFRSAIAAEIGNAAGRDLLELNPAVDAPDIAAALETDDIQTEIVSAIGDIGVQLRARTGVATGDPFGPADISKTPLACLPQGALDVGAWVDPSNFVKRLKKMRSDLYGEFDEVSGKSAVALARHYLAHGWTDEARQILELIAGEDVNRQVLSEMADISDGQRPATEVLASVGHCSFKARLWSILAGAELDLAQESIREALLEFASWPADLRKSLGPRLVTMLRQRGLDKDAEVVARQIADDGSLHRTYVADDAQSGLDRAELLDIVSAGGVESPKALHALIAKDLEDGQNIAQDLITLTEAFALELTGTELSKDLVEIGIKARIQNSDILQAFEDIRRSDLSAKIKEDLLSDLALVAAQNGSEFDLALLSMKLLDVGDLSLDIDAKNALVARLAEIGQSVLANRLISASPDVPVSADARSALVLAQGSDGEASALMADPDVSDPMRLRLSALDGVVSGGLDLIQSDEIRSGLAWRSRQFDLYAGDNRRSGVISHLEPLETDQSAPIERAREALQFSADARADLKDLID